MCIVVGGRATYSRHVDALRIVVSKSEMAAQVEAQVQCAYLWVGGLQYALGWATDSGHEKRNGSAG